VLAILAMLASPRVAPGGSAPPIPSVARRSRSGRESRTVRSQGDKLKVPNNISLLPQPPSSPELNPQENIWQFLRQNYLPNRIYDTYEALVDACREAWNDLIATPGRITSMASISREWAKAVIV
jgi:hypothetical protein